MLCGDDNNIRLRGHEFVGENRDISKSRSFHSQKEREKEAPSGIRTHDLPLTKRMLYQLSY